MQIELLVFDSNTWNHFTVCKQMRKKLNTVTNELFVYELYKTEFHLK